jgi:putative PIN family toxin of toxin-antitoxin system
MRAPRRSSAVVDTNVFVSAHIRRRGHPDALLNALYQGRFTLIVSEATIAEASDVLGRSRFRTKYGLDPLQVNDFIQFMTQDSIVVPPDVAAPVRSRDPDDNKFLAAALAGNADYLVTGDNDLLALRGDPGLGALRIVTVAEFLEVLGAP